MKRIFTLKPILVLTFSFIAFVSFSQGNPTAFTAGTITPTTLQFTWTAGTTNDKAYIVRSTTATPANLGDGLFALNNVFGDGSILVGIVNTPTLTFTDTGLLPGTIYYYKIVGHQDSNDHNSNGGATGNMTTGGIFTSGTLSALPTTYGTASAEGSFTFTATSLAGATETVTITAPTGFEVSLTSGSAFGASVTKNATANAIASTTIFVRVKESSTPATYSGNVTLGSASAPTVNVATTASIVSKKALTMSGLSVPATKIYDGTTTVASVGGTPTLLTAIAIGTGTPSDGKPYSGDAVSITGTASGNYNFKDVATATTVTFGGLSLTGGQANNYTLTIQSAAGATITTKALTMSGLSVPASKIYNGTTTAAVSGTPILQTAQAPGAGTTIDGIPYTGDAVSITGTAVGTYDTKDVASASSVTFTGLSLTGAQNTNYSLTIQSAAGATITTKALTMSGLSVPASKIYDGTTTAVVSGTPILQTAQAPGAGTTIDGIPYTGDAVSITGSATGAYNFKNVLTATSVSFAGLSLTGAQNTNYSLTIQSASGATITTKALTMSGLSVPASKIYDGTTTAVVSGTPILQTAQAPGAGTTIDGIPYTGDAVSITGSATGAYNFKNVLTATSVSFAGLSLTGAENTNYSLTIQSAAGATITPKALTITGATINNKTFNGSNAATLGGTAALLSAQAAGAGTTSDGKPYIGDAVSVTGAATGIFASVGPGISIVVTVTGYSLSGAENSNYTATQPTGLTGTIFSTQPTTQSTALAFSLVTNTTMTVSWSSTGNGSNRILVVKQGGAPTAPTNGTTSTNSTTYTANTVIGSVTAGEITAAGSFVVYSGNGSTVNLTNFNPNTSYTFNLYEYNTTTPGDENYMTAGPLSLAKSTTNEPLNHPASLTAVATASVITLNWPASTGLPAPTNYLVNGRDVTSAGAFVAFSDGSAAPGDDIDLNSGNNGVKSITFGTNTFNGWTNLTAGRLYEFQINPYTTGGSPSPDYKTSPAAPTVQVYVEPSGSASAPTFTNQTTSSIDVTVAGATGIGAAGGYLVIRKATSAPLGLPVDGTVYTAGVSTIGGDPVVYVGAAGAFTDSGLLSLTNYFYQVYPYSGTGAGLINYKTSSPANANTFTLCTPPASQASAISFGASTSSSVVVNITRGATPGTNVLLLITQGVASAVTPVSGTAYTASNSSPFASGSPIASYFVAYNGVGPATTSVTISNLNGNTAYNFKAFEFNSTGTCYLVGSPASGNFTTPSASSTCTLTGGSGAVTLSSIATTQPAGMSVFQWTSTDIGGDGTSSRLSALTFKAGPGNDASLTDFTQFILGAELYDNHGSGPSEHGTAVITSTTITIPSINYGDPNTSADINDLGTIPDTNNKTYTLKIWFKPSLGGALPSTIDGLRLVLSLLNTDIAVVAGKSGYAAGSVNSGGGGTNGFVDVAATQINITTQPSSAAFANAALPTQPIFEATDLYNNRDLNINNAIAVSTTNPTNLGPTSALANFSSGLANFTGSGFKFLNTGTSTMKVNITSPTLSSADTNPITITTATNLGASALAMSPSPLTNNTVGSITAGIGTNAVLRFKLQTTGAPVNLTDIVFTSTVSPTNLVSNFKLYSNSADSFTGAAQIATSASLTFSGMTIPLTAANTYFYLVCDVAPFFPSASPTIQFSLPAGNFTVSTGNKGGVTQTGTNYTLQDITPPSVQSITIIPPPTTNSWSTTNGTSASTVTYRITFNEPVTGISYAGGNKNFQSASTGTANAANPTGAGITNTGAGPYYVDLTVNSVTGQGLYGLNFVETDNVQDLAGNPVGGPGFNNGDFVPLGNGNPASFTTNHYYTFVLPEPTNLAFALTPSNITSSSITLSWTSSATTPLPTHFLLLAKPSTVGSFTSVSDGNYVADASPLTQNVVRVSGANTYTFTGLNSGISYDFIAYKYSLSANNTNDNIDFETSAPATLNNQVILTAPLSVVTLNSTAVPISSLSNASGTSTSVMQFKIYDDGLDPIAPNVMTLNLNGLSQETITFSLRDELTLAEGASVTGFTSSAGAIASAIYSGKGTTNIITLTNSADNTWNTSTTISYNAAAGNAQFLTLGKMQQINAHAVATGTLQIDTFTTNNTFTVPAGVTAITVEAWGAGGSAGGWDNVYGGGSQGGGGGAYSRSLLPVTPGNLYNVTVGLGGTPTSPNLSTCCFAGTKGGSSIFGSSLVVADGGDGGESGTYFAYYGTSYNGIYRPANFGLGGQAGIGSGNVKFSGGNGGNGGGNLITNSGTGPFPMGPNAAGGGGSSAGDSANGNPGGIAPLGICGSCGIGGGGAPVSGGSGGPGFQNSNGSNGGFPGGGGGGTGGNFLSGAGGNGQIKVTYSLPVGAGSSDWAADNAPFKFSQLVITQGAGNSTGLVANWQNIIAGAELFDGTNTISGANVTINPTNITFANIPSAANTDLGYIDDAVATPSSKTYTLKVWLRNDLSNALAATVDGLNLDFKIDPSLASTLTYNDASNSNLKSSRLLGTNPAIEAGASQITVAATKLAYQTPGISPTNTNPQSQIGVLIPFSANVPGQDPEVYALDANNNLDLGYNNSANITNPLQSFSQSIGTIPFSSGKISLNPFYFTTGNTSVSNTQIVVTGTGSPAVTPATSTNVASIISSKTTITAGTAAPGTISSMSTALSAASAPQVNAVQNFEFIIKDDDLADPTAFTDNDALPTRFTQLTINQGTGNDPILGTWTDAIASAQLSNGATTILGTVGATSITFGPLANSVAADLGYIGDGNAKTYGLKITLKTGVTIPDVLDNKDFVFSISTSDITPFAIPNSTSAIQASQAVDSGDGNNTVVVSATQLDFTTQWGIAASQGYDFPLIPNPVAKARDANQNLDLNYNTAATLNGFAFDADGAGPKTYPLANAAATVNNGVITFPAGIQVTSAGNGTNTDISKLVLTSGSLTTGNSNTFTLAYSGNSDIIRETTFVHPTDILYATANNQVADITPTTGVAMERFKFRDGGAAANDTDGTATKLASITIRVSNYQFLQKLAIYEVGVSPTYSLNNEVAELPVSSSATNIVGNTADFIFTGITTLNAADDNHNNFIIKASFNAANVTDNSVINFNVVSVTAGGVSSSFTGGASTTAPVLAATENQTEVVATKLDMLTPAAAAFVSINTNFTPSIEARDNNNNRDLDFTGANSAVTIFSNANGSTMSSGVVTTPFVNGVLDFASAIPTFKFTTGDNNATVTLSMTAGNGSAPTPTISLAAGINRVLTLKTNTIVASATLTEPTTILSNNTSPLNVFDFTIKEDDNQIIGSDAVDTQLSSIKITPSATNTVTNWNDLIASASLTDNASNTIVGTVTATDITFNTTGALGFITDNTSKTYTLNITLRSTLLNGLATSIDNLKLGFEILAAPANVVVSSGSKFSTVTTSLDYKEDSGSGALIDVRATELRFTTSPAASILPAKDISPLQLPIPVVEAVDSNGNRDLNFNSSTINITTTPTILLNPGGVSPLVLSMASGLTTFPTNFQYLTTGDGTLKAQTPDTSTAGSLANGNSTTVTVQAGQATSLTSGAATTGTISSLVNSSGAAVAVFNFVVKDDDGATVANDDGLNTLISSISINADGANNTITDWSQAILGAELWDNNGTPNSKASNPLVTGTNISFTGIPTTANALGFILDNATKIYTLKIYLKPNLSGTQNYQNLIDNLKFAFKVTTTDLGLAANSTLILSTQTATSATTTVKVIATKLDITSPSAASFVSITTNFTPTIEARDANNNRDLDFAGANSAITAFSNANSSTISPAITTTFTSGVAQPTFQFTTGDNNAIVTLSATAGNGGALTPIISTIAPGTGIFNPVLTLKTNTITAGAYVETATISSTSTTAPGVTVFDFKINDDDNQPSGTDVLPTKISQIVITQLSGQQISNWTDLIASATLSDGVPANTLSGTVNPTNITFGPGNTMLNGATQLGYIADDASKTYTLNIVLKSTLTGGLQPTVDNLKIAFEVLAYSTANMGVAAGTSSTFGTNNVASNKLNSGSSTNGIAVVATKVKWSTNPTGGNPAGSLLVNKDIANQLPKPVIEALDVNNNRDLDYVTSLSITNTGSLPMSGTSGSAQTSVTTFNLVADASAPNGGTYTFPNDFQYKTIGNGTMKAVPSAATTIISTTEENSTTVTVRVGVAGTITAGALTEPTTVSSLADDSAGTATGGTDVFDFTINDDPGLAANNTENDGNPTRVSGIIIKQGAGNTVVDWTQAIAAAKISDGTGNSGFANAITANTIDFGSSIPNTLSTDPGYIADGGSKTYTLKIWLKKNLGGNLPFTIDGLRFEFEVAATGANKITTDVNGTSLIGTELENSDPGSVGTNDKVTVIASQLDYQQLDNSDNFISPYVTTLFPANGSVFSPFTPRLGVEAHDANLNRDLDFTGTITAFSTVNSLTFSNGPVVNTDQFTAGTYKLPSLTPASSFIYTSGNNQDGKLSMTAGGITTVSPSINIISSYDSWLYFDPTFTYTTRIPFVSMQETSLTNTTNSVELARLVLSDGGAPGSAVSANNPSPGTKNQPLGSHNDLDGAFTRISSLTISLTNFNDIQKIALFDNAGNKVAGTEQNAAATVTFSGLNTVAALQAADNDVAKFYIRASFNSTVGADLDAINIQITNVVWSLGSKFPITDGTTTMGGIAGAGNLGDSSDPTKNKVDVVATSLDFVTQPSAYAGIDQPIDATTNTSTGIVKARDKFSNLDTDFNYSTLVAATATPKLYPANFTNGILNLTGMQYDNVGDGTLTVTTTDPLTLNSNNLPWASSIKSIPINAINVKAAINANGVLGAPNLKGGTSNQIIFGFDLTPEHFTATEPNLKGFSITFKDKTGKPYAYKTLGTTILKGFKILESTKGSATISASIAGIATITQARSPYALSLGYPATSYDMVTVVFNSGSERNLHDVANPLSYFLVVDVDPTTSIGTPAVTPYLENNGYYEVGQYNYNNILLTQGSANTPIVKGQERSFASTKPPILITGKNSTPATSNPYNGQLNVDPTLTTLSLQFDVPVTTFDGKAELYQKYTNTKVADLTAINGVYQWTTGQSTSPTPYVVNPLKFSIPSGKLIPDTVYYIKIAQGKFDPNNPIDRAGISDDGFNLYGGISFNGTLYFKAASPNPPKMKDTDPLKYYFSNTTATINASFDQFGTAYFMIVDPLLASGAPSNAQIKGTSSFTGAVGRGSFAINQIFPNNQFGSANASLTPNKTYDYWIYSENDASPAITASAPYGSKTSAYAIGAAGPTFSFKVPASIANNINNPIPNYSICANSYTLLSDPIIISETATAQFAFAGTASFNLVLPTGFQFDVTAAPTLKFNGADFGVLPTGTSVYKFINTTILQVNYINTGSLSSDNIIISDLKVIASTPDITGYITRFSGNALTAIIPDGTNLAQITSQSITSINFSNSYSTFNNFSAAPLNITNAVAYIPDNYTEVKLNNAGVVRLIPAPPKGDYGAISFSGSGLSDDILTLNAVALNTAFNITINHTDMNGCNSSKSEQYQVYDHTKAIPQLVNVTYGTKAAIINTKFPNSASNATPLNPGDSISFNGLAGYKLLDLYANIPAKAASSSQIIKGAQWQSLVSQIPVLRKSSYDAVLNQTYKSFYWNYDKILNAGSASLGLTDPYSNFVSQPLPSGNIYYSGGSLGIIEYTGKYQSQADPTVFIPVRQEIELFVPAVPLVETSTPTTTDSVDVTHKQYISTFLYKKYKGIPIFCEAGGPVTLSGYPAALAGTSSGYFNIYDYATYNFTPGATNTPIQASAANSPFIDNGNGTAILDPLIIKNGYKNILVTYTYQDNNSPAIGTGQILIRITGNPVANFIPLSLPSYNVLSTKSDAFCEINTISFDTSPTTNADPQSTLVNTFYTWDFGDPNNLVIFANNKNTLKGVRGTIPAGNTPTASAYEKPTHEYGLSANYPIKLVVTSNFGCASVAKIISIDVGAIPVPDFSFVGVSTADNIVFTDLSTLSSSVTDALSSTTWAYGDATTGTTTTGSRTYANPGYYRVNLERTSTIGCRDSISKQIVVLGRFVANATSTYSESFESSNGNWLPYGTPGTTLPVNTLVNSWTYGAASNKNPTDVKGTSNPTKIWSTNKNSGKYFGKERTALYSLSFDTQGLQRPMISFSTFVKMATNDGVVLQYSIDNLNVADPNKVWLVLGAKDQGLGWFNTQAIGAKPGDQSTGDIGWSGNSTIKDTQINSWQESKYALVTGTTILSTSRIVFRFALATQAGSTAEGFGFDFVRLGERNRTILLESFTNAGNSSSTEKLANDSIIGFKSSKVGLEVVKLNYHVSVKTQDPFNADNSADPSSRALYYSVDKTPASRMDGYDDYTTTNKSTLNKGFDTWGSTQFSTRSLILSQADIVINTTVGTGTANGKITITIDVTPTVDLDDKTLLHIGVLEKQVPFVSLKSAGQKAMVKSGETTFEYILKKMIPNAVGTKTSTNTAAVAGKLKQGIKYTFGPYEYTPELSLYYTPTVEVAAFLQNESTKEIYQSEITNDIVIPANTVTGLESIIPEQVNVYPNPADHEFVIELPGTLRTNVSVRMIDQVGKLYDSGNILAGKNSKTVSSQDLAAGIYIIEILSDEGAVIRKKVMILH